VVSSSLRAEVEPILVAAGVRERFELVVAGEDVVRHKPAPDPYLLAAGMLGAQCPLVVEDSSAGVASAEAAGFACVRVPSPGEMPELVRRALAAPAVAPVEPPEHTCH
jgi:beta-phosphoglucomutase-like phosphatase (HAD superfamily)